MFDQASVESVGDEVTEVAPAWVRLHGAMKSATRRRCAWDAENARHLREAEALQLWNHFGYVSILEYLEREHGIEPRTACDRLRVSHALGELPMLEAELEDGTFQYSHVKELTRVVTPETEDEWIAAAKGKTCAQVQEMVAGHTKGDGPEDPENPDLRLRRFTVELPPQTVVMYRALWAEIEAELGHRIEEAELFRLMIERARVSPEGASTPAQISICSHCKRGWQSGAGGRAELEPAELARVQCDAEHLGSVESEPARKTATISRKKRARILARDQHRCVVPGCRSKRNLDAHHLVHQEDGGGHEDWNICTLCFGHHAAHHRGLLAIEGRAPDGLRFEWRRPEDAHVGANERQRGTTPSPSTFDRVALRVQARDAIEGGAPDGRRFEWRRPEDAHVGANERQPGTTPSPSTFDLVALRTQARDALVGLGWKRAIARAAVDEACAHVTGNVTIDALIREALRRCPRPAG